MDIIKILQEELGIRRGQVETMKAIRSHLLQDIERK